MILREREDGRRCSLAFLSVKEKGLIEKNVSIKVLSMSILP
jgi:hypothetical protein